MNFAARCLLGRVGSPNPASANRPIRRARFRGRACGRQDRARREPDQARPTCEVVFGSACHVLGASRSARASRPARTPGSAGVSCVRRSIAWCGAVWTKILALWRFTRGAWTDSPIALSLPALGWWNWQTRMLEGHVPKGVQVRLLSRAPLLRIDWTAAHLAPLLPGKSGATQKLEDGVKLLAAADRQDRVLTCHPPPRPTRPAMPRSSRRVNAWPRR